MTDPMLSEEAAPGGVPAGRPAKDRSPFVFALVAVASLLGGLVAALALVSLLPGLGVLLALALALVPALLLPAFLGLRAGAALKRKGTRSWLRHLVAGFVILVAQAAIAGGVLQWTSRAPADLAAAGAVLVEETAGEVPLLSGVLKKAAEGATVGFGDQPVAPADAGPKEGADAGLADKSPLSPRQDRGRHVRTFATLVKDDVGDPLIVVTTLKAGGRAHSRVTALDEHAGSVTRVEVADDGSLAVIVGGGELLYAPPAGELEKVEALSRGAAVTAMPRRELRSLSDVAIGPGGNLVAIGELYETDRQTGEAKVLPTLLAWSPKSERDVRIVRQAGEAVPGAPQGSIADGYAFKRPDGSGAFLVVETFLEGGSDIGMDLSGETFTMNPQRLLVGHVDTPSGLVEVARTGDDQNGVSQRTLQAFQDAGRLADGRVIFDASFVEEGRKGWLFSAKPNAVFAVAPNRYDAGNAPWTKEAPRLRHLFVEPEGSFVFLHKSGGVSVGRIDAPVEARVHLDGALAYRPDGTVAGTVRSLSRPTLSKGGDWLVVLARLEVPGKGERQAMLLASREDLETGVAEVLLEEGGVLPGTASQKLRSLSFAEGRDDPLWLK